MKLIYRVAFYPYRAILNRLPLLTFTACNFCYRLIQHAGAKRILFLVDRRTLGKQAKTEFENFTTPKENRKFTDLYNVQFIQSNKRRRK